MRAPGPSAEKRRCMSMHKWTVRAVNETAAENLTQHIFIVAARRGLDSDTCQRRFGQSVQYGDRAASKKAGCPLFDLKRRDPAETEQHGRWRLAPEKLAVDLNRVCRVIKIVRWSSYAIGRA